MASLLAISRAASEDAKRLFKLKVWAHAVGLVFAIVAVLATSPASHVLAVLALIAELAAWFLRYLASKTHSKAEQARRAAMLMWAFNTPEPPDAIDLRSSFGPRIETRAASLEDPNYYASTLPAGQQRFVDMFQESAFWSKHLYRLSSWLAFGSSAAIVMGAFLCFVLLVPTGATGVLSVLAQLGVPIVTFFISVDLLGQGLAWHEATTISDRIDRALERSQPPSPQDLLSTFSEYSVAIACAPPIPTFLHRREHDRLEREWRRRKGRV
jgi:hypothetical protein